MRCCAESKRNGAGRAPSEGLSARLVSGPLAETRLLMRAKSALPTCPLVSRVTDAVRVRQTLGPPALPRRVATERDQAAPGSPAAGRATNARAAAGMAARGVRSSVVGLLRTVHCEGDRGFIARLIGIARDKGVSG